MIRPTAEREGFPVVVANPFLDDRWKHLRSADFHAPASDGHLGGAGLGLTARVLFERLQGLRFFDRNGNAATATHLDMEAND